MEKECRAVGGTLAILEKDQLEFVRSLGQMETVSQNARGKLSELTSAFTELSLQYKHLTDEEKQGDFGTALAESLEQLKVRISDARADMQEVERTVSQIGGAFEQLAQEIGMPAEELQAFIDKASSSRQKLADYNKSLDALTQAYRNLSEEEKKGEKGQKLAASMDQLKVKIKDTEKELKGVEKELGDSGLGGVLDKLASKLGIPVEIFTKFGPILAAVGAAAKIAKDAFNANESAVDEWGRTVEMAKGVYEGFLTSLNTGDFGGFLSRISDITAAARKAYDELDRLGTMKTIQSPEMSRQQTENERNRMMIQTRRYIAPMDGSQGIPGMKNGQLLSEEQVKQIESDLQNGIQRVVDLITNEVQQSTNAIDAVYNKQAQTLGMSIDEFKKGTSSMAEFDRMIKLAEKYYEFEDAHTTYTYSRTGVAVPSRDQAINPYDGYQKWNVFRVDGDAFKNLVALIQQRDQQMSQAYSTQSQAFRAINRAEGITARNGAPTADVAATEGSIKAQEAEVARLTDLWKNATAELRDGYKAELDDAKRVLDQMVNSTQQMPQELNPTMNGPERSPFERMQMSILAQQADQAAAIDENSLKTLMGVALQNGINGLDLDFSHILDEMREGLDIPAETWKELETKINEQLASLNLAPIKLNFETGNLEAPVKTAKDTAAAWQAASAAISTVGAALQQIDDPAAKIAGILATAVANIALGFANATASPATGAAGIFGWIAATTAGLATMISTITAIKSVTSAGKFAEGGIVPGNNYNDGLVANVSSGELILNRAQQDSIASQLTANPFGNLQLSTRLSGTDLLILLNNTNRSLGGGRNFYTERH